MVHLILEPLLLRRNDENVVVITLQNKVFHNFVGSDGHKLFSCNNPSKQGLPQHEDELRRYGLRCNNLSKQGLPQRSEICTALEMRCNNLSKQGLPQPNHNFEYIQYRYNNLSKQGLPQLLHG